VGKSHDNRKKAEIECTCPKRLPKPKKKKMIKKTNPVYIEAMKLAIANSEKGNDNFFYSLIHNTSNMK